ncbi:GNAT family N-acetyltransferase [Vibrio sp. DW001]|uniref:GNAT family N-acetyltransferase n=1 Tax=Vibrio sp. DW001 TaxID=2912315 RepID=UPI0023AEA5C2|nr:GNAT family N-acetyltransferase [Vibrio sp. DW001]WED29703.1 GNAT family N-acetyltransferase [Vibrio sp. DW001]
MLEIKKIGSIDEIRELRAAYFEQTKAPLDGMWHFGFAPMSNHFGFYEDKALVGYCCVNEDGYLLQFYLSPVAKVQATELFTLIAQQNSVDIGEVVGAFVSTAETDYLSLCLDNSSSFTVNALMYCQNTTSKVDQTKWLEMKMANQEQLKSFVEFAIEAIGAPEQWLSGYYDNLIKRQELWGYWIDEKLVASGECRLFDEYQVDFADMGMIVAKSERGKGIATRVLRFLKNRAAEQGLKVMCSTECGNTGAQKAIMRAGLTSSNRIVQFEFDRA